MKVLRVLGRARGEVMDGRQELSKKLDEVVVVVGHQIFKAKSSASFLQFGTRS